MFVSFFFKPKGFDVPDIVDGRLGEVLLDVIRSSGGDGGAPVGSHSMILIEEIKRVGSSAMSVVLSRCVRQVVSACLVACDYDALGEIASAEGMEPDVAMMHALVSMLEPEVFPKTPR